jgi:hypothetical protein
MSVSKPQWVDRRLPRFFVEWRDQWESATPDVLTPIDYLDQQGAPAIVVAAGWLFCPETVEYRGCIFLAERFDEGNVDTWFRQLDGIASEVEAMVNQTKLFDLFSNADLDQSGQDLDQLALAIGECWQGVLSVRYQDRDITVEVSDNEDGSYGPTVTFWSEPNLSGAPDIAEALSGL